MIICLLDHFDFHANNIVDSMTTEFLNVLVCLGLFCHYEAFQNRQPFSIHVPFCVFFRATMLKPLTPKQFNETLVELILDDNVGTI